MFFADKSKKEDFYIRGEKYPVKEKGRPFFLFNRNNDTVAVLVHGFTNAPHDMRELAEKLYSHDINVFVARIAGHGSHIDDLVETTYKDWTDSLDDAIEKAVGDHSRVFLLGYSFGGNLVLDHVYRSKKQYDGIVCIGSSIYIRMPKIVQAYIYYANHLLRFFGKKKWKKPYIKRGNVDSWESTGNYAYLPMKGMLDWNYFVQNHTIKQIHDITVPALIMHSRDDKVTHPNSAQYIFDNIGSHYKELFMIPEYNHNPLKSESRDVIFNKILAFIDN